MKSKTLSVLYNGRLVGRIASTKVGLCAFEYDAGWLVNGFSLSPFSMPLEKKVLVAPRDPFDGNFGVFNDSLPDGWGRLLIDRMLVKNRINLSDVSTIDRLAIVGSSGMGALEYRPETPLSNAVVSDDIDQLARECEQILNDNYDGNLEGLVRAGGSSGGARPKGLIKYDGADWIVKFRSSEDPKDIGKREYEYSIMAREAGLEMPETKLFEGQYFGVKRFDRKAGGSKVHMLSASGLLGVSHRFPALDYMDLLRATLMLTRDYGEVEKMFRLMCFNVFSHNRDDHAKNFSFLYDDGRWQISPAYDLVYSEGMRGEHTTTIAGEGKNPTENHIMQVAKEVGINEKKAKSILEKVKSATDKKS